MLPSPSRSSTMTVPRTGLQRADARMAVDQSLRHQELSKPFPGLDYANSIDQLSAGLSTASTCLGFSETPSSSDLSSFRDEANEPTQEALTSLMEMLKQQKTRLLHENQMLSLESEISRLSKENQALRASMETAQVNNMTGPLVPPNFMVLQALQSSMAIQASAMRPTDSMPGNSYGLPMMAHPAVSMDGQSLAMDKEAQLPFTVGPGSANQQRLLAPGPVGLKKGTMMDDGGELDSRTTVMLRNLPNNYTREMLLELIDSQGFNGLYDFLYLPIDFQTYACLGYAFVNLVDANIVPRFWAAFDGFNSWTLPSKKVCYVSWSGPHQGLQAHIDRYRNSPVMHADVIDQCKPVCFRDGKRVPFPSPTRSIRPPRVRKQDTTKASQQQRHVRQQHKELVSFVNDR
eukprot:TRINITY_DN8720_c0_g1_i2.p1 TRINITY_DN8720_c0_g1~~TRINITY_DN8720_c0_g1_i2.p1  ORF type:complete len:403 (+),score=70.69 TRINITY_DN8720_c0_g1_i2:772-1980(+)